MYDACKVRSIMYENKLALHPMIQLKEKRSNGAKDNSPATTQLPSNGRANEASAAQTTPISTTTTTQAPQHPTTITKELKSTGIKNILKVVNNVILDHDLYLCQPNSQGQAPKWLAVE